MVILNSLYRVIDNKSLQNLIVSYRKHRSHYLDILIHHQNFNLNIGYFLINPYQFNNDINSLTILKLIIIFIFICNFQNIFVNND
jgi:hypothetical protein